MDKLSLNASNLFEALNEGPSCRTSESLPQGLILSFRVQRLPKDGSKPRQRENTSYTHSASRSLRTASQETTSYKRGTMPGILLVLTDYVLGWICVTWLRRGSESSLSNCLKNDSFALGVLIILIWLKSKVEKMTITLSGYTNVVAVETCDMFQLCLCPQVVTCDEVISGWNNDFIIKLVLAHKQYVVVFHSHICCVRSVIQYPNKSTWIDHKAELLM